MENIPYSVSQIKLRLTEQRFCEISDETFSGFPAAAVFLLLTDTPYGTSLLLVKRSNKVSTHKGEICFPGGKKDNTDESLLTTAYREIYEEIGVPKDAINLICSLSPEVTRTGYVILPFVGHLLDGTVITPDMKEIEEVMYITLENIMDPKRKRTIDYFSEDLRIHKNGFMINNYLVWGATFNITNELISRIKLSR